MLVFIQLTSWKMIQMIPESLSEKKSIKIKAKGKFMARKWVD